MMTIYVVFTLLTGVVLFGGMGLSMVTDNLTYFLVGYPISIVLFLIASFARIRVLEERSDE